MLKKVLLILLCLQTISALGLVKAFTTQRHDIRAALIHMIQQERKSIDVAMYMMTDAGIINGLREAHLRGVTIRVILDQASRRCYEKLLADGIYAKLYIATGSNNFNVPLMHNKYFIFGHNAEANGPLLWTGSFNCTPKASKLNSENAVIVDDLESISLFRESFQILLDQIILAARNARQIDEYMDDKCDSGFCYH